MAGNGPALWIVAGPNGVGKTTYALRHIRAVSGTVHFVNLDEIARGLSPLDPEVARRSAARVAIARITELIVTGRSLSFETTLAGKTHLRTISLAERHGYAVNLLYFAVPEPAICEARVARRVAEGGHDVPVDELRRRFWRSAGNFALYSRRANVWRIVDNRARTPVVVAEGHRECRSMAGDLAGLPAPLVETILAMPPCPERVAGAD